MTTRRIAPAEAIRRLLTTVALPVWNAVAVDNGLELLEAVIRETSIVELLYPLGEETGVGIVRTLSGVAA